MDAYVLLIYDNHTDHRTWVRCESLQRAQALCKRYDPYRFNVDIHPIGPVID